jgi:hypothetical protein
MNQILFTGTPLKIFNSVVGLDAIQVVDLVIAVRVFQESLRNQTMNDLITSRSLAEQGHLLIPVSNTYPKS